ncbi:transglycosylase domain-containing protein [Gloeocapsopsis dulcis]|uniref:Penicillin-binding protein n=1 Tax=Gloeocapsopsis dulcis AAB1 = 1H9 TaxID=1433147 RepID=A0A6N8FR86_9CHRO|nr:penicillin-binding protein 1A [Gloeocapsopsis dulcis]MUL35660.1 penicillin-binding protein [Gloeocapsopsis dulcis AAB1 = 1H9]WNN87440.1 penicillin-binding protein 1A [Gloeocapsopsis dulcis]
MPWLKEQEAIRNTKPAKKTKTTPSRQQLPRRKIAKVLTQIKQLPQQLVSLPTGKQPQHRRSLWLIGIGGSAIALGGIWFFIEQSLPQTTELFTVVRDETLTIKAADGTILQQTGPATREQLQLAEIPEPLVQAFIASEDRRFYRHNGIDYQGVVRATLSNLRSANVVEGGSTITQQLARILFLNQERTVWRKLKEIRLSQKIEANLTKEQILERYLNLVYLGEGAYGVADAAWVYFSKPVNQLTLPEMAMIAGLAPAPSRYSPAVNLAAAQQRRNLVLRRMREDRVLDAATATAASTAPITLNTNSPKRLQVTAPYFTTYIQKELPKYIAAEDIEAGGLIVETTLNPQWQNAAETAVKNTVTNNGRWQNFEQAALVAINPRNGEIRALVGGKDFEKNQFNRATQAQRQPGSTFKGFLYAAAIATGLSPYNSYLDAPYIVEGYEPKNYSREFRGWLTMRDALTSSINTIAVKVLIDVGFDPVIKLAQQMGIKSQLQPMYSLALGSSEVNLLELTSAYGTLATQGMHAEPHGIRRILNRSGEVLYSIEHQPKRVLDPGSAAITTWMLQNVVQSGTGRPAFLNRPVAGKTGTSDESRDLWFVGYIPQLVAGVWLGNDNNEPTWGNSGTAAATWRQFMRSAVEDMPVEDFPERPTLTGRKGSMKAQPIKPQRVSSSKISSSSRNSDNNNRSRRSYRRNQQEANVPQPRRRSRRRDERSATPTANPRRSDRTPTTPQQGALRERLRNLRQPDSPRKELSPAQTNGSSGGSSTDYVVPTKE